MSGVEAAGRDDIVESEFANGQVVEALVVNLVLDVGEENDIVKSDGCGQLNVEVDATSLIGDAALDEVDFSFTESLGDGFEANNLTQNDLLVGSRSQFANLSGSHESRVTRFVVLLLVIVVTTVVVIVVVAVIVVVMLLLLLLLLLLLVRLPRLLVLLLLLLVFNLGAAWLF